MDVLKISINNLLSDVNSDFVAVNYHSKSIVALSIADYPSKIDLIEKEMKKDLSCYIKGKGTYRLSNKERNIIKKKTSLDLVHLMNIKKDTISEHGSSTFYNFAIFFNNQKELEDSLYAKIYNNTAIPVLREWMSYLYQECKKSRYAENLEIYDQKNGDKSTLQGVEVSLTESQLARIISDGIKNNSIFIKENATTSDAIKEISGLDTYLANYAEILADKIKESFKPKFNPSTDQYEEKLIEFDDYCYDDDLELFEAQKSVIQAAVNNLNTSKFSLVIGEMGCGKTLLGAGITYVHHKLNRGSNSIIMCPAHLVNKWKREIERVVPNAEPYIVGDIKDMMSLEDNIKNKLRTTNLYIIISKEKAKLGFDYRPAVRWSESKKTFICPECGHALKKLEYYKVKNKRYSREVNFERLDMLRPMAHNMTCSHKHTVIDQETRQEKKVTCGASLWTILNKNEPNLKWLKLGSEGWIWLDHINIIYDELIALPNRDRKTNKICEKLLDIKDLPKEDIKQFSRAPRKYPLSKYIKNNFKGYIDYFIADELHELSAKDSLQSEAFGDLIKVSNKTIGLTGTLLNGYADSLFYTLYRLCPNLMKKNGYDYNSVSSFLNEYGVVKKTKTYSGNGSSRESLSSNEKKLPGVSPLIFTKFLLENAVFLSLSDMEEGLPSYEEIPIGINMDEDLKQGYKDLEGEFKRQTNNVFKGGLKIAGNMVRYLSVFPDMPYELDDIIHPDTNEVVIIPPSLPKGLRNKENALLDLILEKKAAGEKVLLFYHWSNKSDVVEKLGKLLADNNIKFANLANVDTASREEWINKRVEEGVDVIMTNPKLVETGLDLLDFTSIIFYQLGYNIYTMRQASRRSWRLSQTKDIKVYFMYYKETVQEQALSLMATKLHASMAIEGKFSEEGLKAMSNNEDLLTQIANSVVNGIQYTVDATVFNKTNSVKRERVKRPKKLKNISNNSLPLNKQRALNLTQMFINQLFKKQVHIGELYNEKHRRVI